MKEYTAYHVVTERPMTVGQVLCLDETYPSGVYRRVMEKVTHLVLITDPSRKGTQVIDTIKRVADELVMYDRCGAIVNRVTDPALIPYIHINGTEILATIGSDPQQDRKSVV